MKMPRIIYYPVRRSPYRAIRKFSHSHKLSAAVGAITLAVILVKVISSLIEVARRKKYTPETEMIDNAIKAIHSGNLNKALSLINRVEILYPNSHQALYLRGVIYLQKKQYEDARDSLQKAVKINSTIGEYHLSLSIVLYHLGKIHDALIQLKKAKDMVDKDTFNSYLEEAGLTELSNLMNADSVSEAAYVN